MDKNTILAMEVGRELDALVEDTLFNHKVEWRYCNWFPEGWYEVQSYYDPNLPSSEQYTGGLLDEDELHPCYWEAEKWAVVRFYSTDIPAAWPVVEKMRSMEDGHGNSLLCCLTIYSDHDLVWDISWRYSELGDRNDGHKEHRLPFCYDELPEAICKAALLTRLA